MSDKKRLKWERPEKIATAAVLVALVAVINPYGAHLIDNVWSSIRGPRASFSAPLPGSTQPSSLGASGTSSGITPGSGNDLWLVVRSVGVEGRWYPVERLDTSTGQWSVPPGVIRPALGHQELQLILLNDSNEGVLLNYFKQLRLYNRNPGLDRLPSGNKVEDYRLINVV